MLEIGAGEAFFHQEFWEWLMEKLTFGQRLERGVAEPGVGRPGLKKEQGWVSMKAQRSERRGGQGDGSELVGVRSHSFDPG